MSQDWKYGICDCLQTPWLCLWSVCVPGGYICMQMMAVNNALEHEEAGLSACCLIYWLGAFGAAVNRMEIRKAYNIKGNYCFDLICWCCCPFCSNVQEYRESMNAKYNDHYRKPWTFK